MDVTVNYGLGAKLPSSITVPSALSVTETDLFKIVNESGLKYSQLTIYIGVTLGAVASATFYYYYSTDGGTTWFPVSLYNTSTGEITQRSVLVDSGSYSTGGVYSFADNIPLGATTAFKVTGKSASATPTLNTCLVVGRHN